MKKIVILVCLMIACFLSSCNNAYTVASEKTCGAGNPDLYIATSNELKNQSLVKYEKKFAEVPDEKAAVSVAEKVLDEVYEDCSKREKPFIVFFNTTANAWIVIGTLPKGYMGGVGYIAIEKDSGEILLLQHDK